MILKNSEHNFVDIKVDEKDSKCFVGFEDDSEYWVLYKDLQKGN